ncbi:Uncharacterised protein [uncultured archaeon]|nr:Uncharacterised protein [uncultured archaeon]
MERIEMTQKELERERRKFNKPTRNYEFIPIENFTAEENDGDYSVENGKRIPMRIYGEKITEEGE